MEIDILFLAKVNFAFEIRLLPQLEQFILTGGAQLKKQDILASLSAQAKDYYQLSDKIWDNPEVRFTEYHSSKILANFLEKEGFYTEWGLAGMKTAFRCTWGSGKPTIGFLAEFDALPNLSQKANIAEKQPLENNGNGHGCGHNLLGVGSLIGAIGTKQYLESNQLPGTIVFLGCPAEEGGGGKTFMAREGCFDLLDCALTWHPGCANGVPPGIFLANCMFRCTFTGRASHAAAFPECGRSALDALELMNVGIQFLREHIPSTARLHYAITDAGGTAPNIVQAKASGLYQIRAPYTPMVIEIYEKLKNIAKGAALMTETEVNIEFLKATSNTMPNTVLDRIMHQNMKEVPLPKNGGPQQDFAEQIMRSQLPEAKRPLLPLDETIQAYMPSDNPIPASTDVGDVSWVCPVSQIGTATWPVGTAPHSWQAVACGKSDFAHRSMLYAGQVIAASAIDILTQPDILTSAWAEFNCRTNNQPYQCPIPKEISPGL